MGVLYENYGIIGDIIVGLQFTFKLYLCQLIHSQPFTNEYPRADIYELIAPDILHQIIKGTFKDHLVTWVEEILLHIHNNDTAKVNRILDDIDRR